MRKAQKKQTEDFIALLSQAHAEIRAMIEQGNYNIAMDLMGQCQDGALYLADFIEKTEGEGFKAISLLIEYYKLVYQVYEELGSGMFAGAGHIYERLQSPLVSIAECVKTEIKVKLEIVFLPYKASMWDSLESIWMAADADPDCDAYVVPIPYYERNADGSLGAYHYEGGEMPDYVPVTRYDSFHLEKRRPDVIYIHNPYDQGNFITSVDPRYYSAELKKYTDLLIYVPYYATSGGMSERQSLCRAYLSADYIVVQAEKFKKFFDPIIPREKLLPLGSPKFDRVIRLCNNPPQPPAEWKSRMDGRKVYFYNTSVGGMLEDARRFLMKMEYVFKCFQGRNDACLLWRPHPLLESAFKFMQKEYKTYYDELKQSFIQNELGIYDDTPDIEETIALCDAYIGDSGTSVTSLFGIVGKPLFILNNNINTLPEEDDWRGEIIRGFFADGQDEWMVTQGNKLYHSPRHDYHYEYYCDLSEYTSGNYYLRAMEIDGNVYVCPQNAQDILIVSDRRIVKRIALTRRIEQPGAFCNVWRIGKYLFLIPFKYPAIVRYDVESGRVDYLEGYNDIFVREIQGEWRIGGSCIWGDLLFIASPVDNQVLVIDSDSMEVRLRTAGEENGCGCMGMVPYEGGICMLPYEGTAVTCWNPDNGTASIYSHMPDGFQCKSRPLGLTCMTRSFGLAAVDQNRIVLPPYWGNMFVSINMENGTAEEWICPVDLPIEEKNGYFMAWGIGSFLQKTDTLGEGTYRYFHKPNRKLYDINPGTGEWREIKITFDKEELLAQEPGFGRGSDWLKYGCEEKALYSLTDFLDRTHRGAFFDKESEVQAYGEIAANNDGTCGEKVHQFAWCMVRE